MKMMPGTIVSRMVMMMMTTTRMWARTALMVIRWKIALQYEDELVVVVVPFVVVVVVERLDVFVLKRPWVRGCCPDCCC